MEQLLRVVTQVEVSDRMLQALYTQGKWEGKLPCTVEPTGVEVAKVETIKPLEGSFRPTFYLVNTLKVEDKEGRVREIKRKVRAVQAKRLAMGKRGERIVRTSLDQRRIVTRWNTHPYILQLVQNRRGEVKNYQIPTVRVPTLLPTLRRLLSEIGVDRILSSMEEYFRVCEEGGHVWGEENHGFSDLSGFIDSLHRSVEEGRHPWWERRQREDAGTPISDPFSSLTSKLISEFARELCPDPLSFKVPNPSRDYRRFALAAQKLHDLVDSRKFPLSTQKGVALLIRCVKKNHGDNTIYPGHLCTEALWKYEFPQYLREVLPVPK